MKKFLTCVVAVVVITVGFTGTSFAESTTVSGTGDIEKMAVNNGPDAVVVKIFGPGGPCDVRYVAATLRGTNGVTYKASGGCYSGGQWIVDLSKGTKSAACGGDRLAYKSSGGFWRFSVPRDCLRKLSDKIKASGELTFSAMPGAAGPSKWLRRG
jgi:hypothetical protein